ncbi:MAG: pentapeptide repeat-containing protein [Minicystis sp.]
MHAILQKANLRGADLEKANLFGADASRMVGDDETSLSGANVKRVSFVAARRPDEQR